MPKTITPRVFNAQVVLPPGTETQLVATLPLLSGEQGANDICVSGDWQSPDYPLTRPFWLNFVFTATTLLVNVWRVSATGIPATQTASNAGTLGLSTATFGADQKIWLAFSDTSDPNNQTTNFYVNDALGGGNQGLLGPRNKCVVNGMCLGPDGNVWFAQQSSGIAPTSPVGPIGTDCVGFILPIASSPNLPQGVFKTTTFNNANSLPYQGIDLISGPNNHIWMLAYVNSTPALTYYILEFNPNATGPLLVNSFVVPTGASVRKIFNSKSICYGPDGNIWWVDNSANVHNITPTGTITNFAVPGATVLRSIITGPDGRLWFSGDAGTIYAITTALVLSTYPSTTSVINLWSATTSPDGVIWFCGENFFVRVTTAGVQTKAQYVNTAGNQGTNLEGFFIYQRGNYVLAHTQSQAFSTLSFIENYPYLGPGTPEPSVNTLATFSVIVETR